jgi:hypothetical protein
MPGDGFPLYRGNTAMRATAALSLALILSPLAAAAQDASAAETMRAGLIAQARAARAREDYAACATFLESAAAIRPDNLVRYAAGQCAFAAGRLAEAERIAADCLGQSAEGDPYRAACAALAAQVRALAAPEPVQPPAAPAPPTAAVARPEAAPPPRLVREALPPPVLGLLPPAPASRVPVGAIALWTAGGALLATAAVSAALHGAALDGCEVQGTRAVCASPADLDRAREAGTWATLGTVGFWGGLAAVAGGTAWWLFGRRVEHLAVAVTPAGVSLSGRF